MASGPTCRAKRPNTWLHRPMLHTFKTVLANSEPSTHGGKADMTVCRSPLSRSLMGVKRTWRCAPHMSAFDPKRTYIERDARLFSPDPDRPSKPHRLRRNHEWDINAVPVRAR